MQKIRQTLIYSVPASLWDTFIQLSGILEIWEKELVFRLLDFKDSHLNLCIPFESIEQVKEYLVFDLAKNGLRIQNKDGKFDLFVLEEVSVFKKVLSTQIKKSLNRTL